MQIKTTMRYHLTQDGYYQKDMRKQCWKGCRENVTFVHCWYRYKLVPSLWKHYAGSSKELKIELPYEINGEGNGNPLQCSCLENPMDGGA